MPSSTLNNHLSSRHLSRHLHNAAANELLELFCA